MNAPLMRPPPAGETLDVAIIGAGFSGMCMAIHLKQAGRSNFAILEKADDLGGTWRDNTYPGCACDVPSHLYSFSFDLNPDWSRMYAGQAEIWDYMRRCARKYGIEPFIRYNKAVTRASHDEALGLWRVETSDGETVWARVLVSGVGALHIPAYPNIPGLERFGGKAFHSAHWDHDYDLTGKRVAVIGTGASAIQFVPEIAPQVEKLHVFQRTPPWILPRMDRPMTAFEQRLFRALPFLQWLFRGQIYARMEMRALGFTINPKLIKRAEQLARDFLDRSIPDPDMREKLTPDYTMGCKRVLLSNDYYATLLRENVELVTDPIAEVHENGVVMRDGTVREVDAIIYGTGFKATDPLAEIDIYGPGGRSLKDDWKAGAEAYLGTAVAGYPNLFLLLGPNTGLGHNSIIYMIESQVHYIMECLRLMDERGIHALDPKEEVQAAYNHELQERLARTVWQSGCQSWYLTEDGRNTTIWPGFTFSYRKRTRRPRLEDFRMLAASAPASQGQAHIQPG
jgi:cation diffusion facilitator CzcD-associated flavoprotein CzcO